MSSTSISDRQRPRLLDRLFPGVRVDRAVARARELETRAHDELLSAMDGSLEAVVDGHPPNAAFAASASAVAKRAGRRPLAAAAAHIAAGLREHGLDDAAASVVVVEMRRRLIDHVVEALDRKLKARLWAEPAITGVVARVRSRGEDDFREGARR